MQRGQFFPDLGSFLLFVSPPDDLRNPPTTALQLEAGKSEYHFKIKHKYVGPYVVWLKFRESNVKPNSDGYSTEITVSKNGQQIYKKSGPFPKKDSGDGLLCYQVPQDAPVDIDLEAIVKITGNIEEFIRMYGPAELNINLFVPYLATQSGLDPTGSPCPQPE